MAAITYNLTKDARIEQGADYWMNLVWKDPLDTVRDLSSGWSARMQIRNKVSSPDYFVELTTEDDGGIILTDGVSSEYNIEIHITAEQTLLITSETCVYDLLITDLSLNYTYKLIEGKIAATLCVTR